MNSIEAAVKDMKQQIVDLPVMPLPKGKYDKIVLAGSGDSYAAALLAYHLSSGRALCCYPTDIITDPAITSGCSVFLVSISGRTRANILAAKSACKAGATTIAVTANENSPLVTACDSSFLLKFKSAGKTFGTISFTASMLTCARIAAEASCPADLRQIYNAAERKAAEAASNVSARNVVVLGDSLLYPIARYGALKFSEVLGSRIAAYSLEDFCHAPLFGHRGDQVIILSADSTSISSRLERAGLNSLHVNCNKSDRLSSAFYATFFIQHLVLAIAIKKKMNECYFLQNPKLLDTSSDIIY